MSRSDRMLNRCCSGWVRPEVSGDNTANSLSIKQHSCCVLPRWPMQIELWLTALIELGGSQSQLCVQHPPPHSAATITPAYFPCCDCDGEMFFSWPAFSENLFFFFSSCKLAICPHGSCFHIICKTRSYIYTCAVKLLFIFSINSLFCAL